MALPITQGVPTLFVRREAYERAGLTRASIDERLGLTDAEFRAIAGVTPRALLSELRGAPPIGWAADDARLSR